MTYVYGYLGIGLFVLIAVYSAHRLTRDKWKNELRDALEATKRASGPSFFSVLDDLVAPIFACLFVIVAWPIALYMKGKDILSNGKDRKVPERIEFAVSPQNLQTELTVAQVEARETVIDPLGAAPMSPFGHLNAVWKDFLDGLAEGDQIWSFSAQWQPKWGQPELRSGYVLVRHGVPANYFVTARKQIPDKSTGM